jgi:hypothetical protein
MAAKSKSKSRRKRSTNGSAGNDWGLWRDAIAMASGLAQTRKDAGADKLAHLAEAAETISDNLDDIPYLKAYAQTAAEGLDDLSAYVRATELGEMIDDIAALARKQPAITFAASLAGGILLVQFARNWRESGMAGSRHHEQASRHD